MTSALINYNHGRDTIVFHMIDSDGEEGQNFFKSPPMPEKSSGC